GSVAVANLRGDEVLLSTDQQVKVFEDRLGRVEYFEGHPERPDGRQDKRKDDKRKDARRVEAERDRLGRRELLKAALEREVGFTQGRDALESRTAFDQKAAVYQQGKTLIDAFGKRVRVEEYILRPNPISFTFVTLNFRDNRLDTGTLQVTANAPLPKDLQA